MHYKFTSTTHLKRAALTLLALIMTCATAWADNITLNSSMTEWTNGNTYILNSNVTISQRILVTGHVTLQLGSGYTLTSTEGIRVEYDDNASTRGVLTITGNGTLDIPDDLDDFISGISVNQSNELHIEGGIIRAHGGRNAPGIGTANIHLGWYS